MVGNVSGDKMGHCLGWRSHTFFQQKTRALATFLLLSDMSSVWLYLDQSLEHDV